MTFKLSLTTEQGELLETWDLPFEDCINKPFDWIVEEIKNEMKRRN